MLLLNSAENIIVINIDNKMLSTEYREEMFEK